MGLLFAESRSRIKDYDGSFILDKFGIPIRVKYHEHTERGTGVEGP